jgi:hypothetical protein
MSLGERFEADETTFESGRLGIHASGPEVAKDGPEQF